MKRQRAIDENRRAGMGFISIVLAVLLYLYFGFVFVTLWSRMYKIGWIIVLCIIHFLFINLMLAFYQSVMVDPGVVPPNWGFYMGDETKRRRYCKMCNVWKPDRTHHCSICNRCVLNMDHHCPWINNCVGYYNRKFFMQLLFYAYLCLLFQALTGVWDLGWVFYYIWRSTHGFNNIHFPYPALLYGRLGFVGILFLQYAFCFLLLATLTQFVKFHIKLVSDNFTTIENLEREPNGKSRFDIGCQRNWEQVFGTNLLLWWLPMHTALTRPAGDGVRWRVHYTRVQQPDYVHHDPAPSNSDRTVLSGR
eukprot:Filipodium_phascolosomae@DN2489_c0_g1_i7.p1